MRFAMPFVSLGFHNFLLPLFENIRCVSVLKSKIFLSLIKFVEKYINISDIKSLSLDFIMKYIFIFYLFSIVDVDIFGSLFDFAKYNISYILFASREDYGVYFIFIYIMWCFGETSIV